MLGNRRRARFKFTEKRHSLRAMIAGGIAIISLLMFVIFVSAATSSKGALSTYYGSAGILALAFAIVALVMSIISEKEEDSFKTFPHLAFALSVIATLLWAGTYIFGFIL